MKHAASPPLMRALHRSPGWLRPAPARLGDAVALRKRTGSTRAHALRQLQGSFNRYRRLIAAGCIAIALTSGLSAVERKPTPTATVITASRDLPAGVLLRPGDLRTVAFPHAVAPVGSYHALFGVVGRQLAAPLRAGEPVTDVRLDGGVLARPARGLVSAAVRFADAEAARLLRPGQHIDVLAASGATDARTATTVAAVVAADVDVLAVVRPADLSGSARPAGGSLGVGADAATEGALVILATTPTQARQLAQAQVTARLSAIVVG